MKNCIIILVLMMAASASLVFGQVESKTDYAWRQITRQEGLQIDYIYYGAESHRKGLVARLRNHNAHAVEYRFVVVIRSEEREYVDGVRGVIAAQSDLTGDDPGLYWAPFDRGESITEVGLRGLRIGAMKAAE